ncbi:Gfo/Idh/MocA family protein [Cohnella faecalis]|uniref:Gfo/Idh/MocA family oxidoreductase n=1 Tax=Cohnella faecalis TaxID=2315694 RepID=A0A398CNE3_9BACL|nr:Gfo/Idh/MocA family oxidoreductase [Cohnella faecalis]RIE01101.1 gfo/Idh/MocA family oxidoreductase [Cohnella faecalis]
MRKLKVGMLSFAHGHAFSYLYELMRMPNVEVVGIADRDRERVSAVLEQYKLPYFSDYRELIGSDVEAVIICSENAYHTEMAVEAARQGKHILCEKPLGIGIPEMDQMIREAKANGVQLMTAFPCRFVPAVVEAKKAIDKGEIGKVVAIRGTNRGTKPAEPWFTNKELSGGGAVLDHTVHVTDLMNWFMSDSRVCEVYALAETLYHDIDVDDAGMVHMRYDNGVIAVLDPSWSRPKSYPTWGDVTMEIVGTEGSISVDCFKQSFDLYRDEVMKANWSYFGDSMDHYMLKAFVDAIFSDSPVPVSGEDGKLSAVVALAAYNSAALGQPVKL